MTKGMNPFHEIAERLAAHAVKIGLSDDYNARISWANESNSVYLSLPGCRKIRISDHGAAYPCSISVDPFGMTEADAVKWLDAEAADEAEQDETKCRSHRDTGRGVCADCGEFL